MRSTVWAVPVLLHDPAAFFPFDAVRQVLCFLILLPNLLNHFKMFSDALLGAFALENGIKTSWSPEIVKGRDGTPRCIVSTKRAPFLPLRQTLFFVFRKYHKWMPSERTQLQ